MADTQLFYQLPTFTLAGAGCSIGDTSIILTSMKDADGLQVIMATLGTKSWITLEPDNSTQEEQISFTGITVNANETCTLTGVKNVLLKSPYTETTGVFKTHAGGTKAIVSNTAAFYDNLTSKDNDETISGLYTFTQLPQSTAVPTVNADLTNKLYVDNTVASGVADMSTTTKGKAKISVAPLVATNPIVVGDNDTRVPTAGQAAALPGNNADIAVGSGNKYVTQTGLQNGTEVYALTGGTSTAYTLTLSPVPIGYVAGERIYFKAHVGNGGATTIAKNGLTATPIYKRSVTGTTALAVADIGTGQMVVAEYDGGAYQLLNPTANPKSFISALTSLSVSTSTNTDTTFVTPFLPTTIAIYYLLSCIKSDGNGLKSQGVALYNSAGTLIANQAMFTNQLFATALFPTFPTHDITAPTAGNGSGSGIIGTLSITSVTATGFTVRWATTQAGVAPAAALFTCIATN